MEGGLVEEQSLLSLTQEALSSLSGTLEEKMSAVESAVVAESVSLETKLCLIEAAVQSGFADTAKAQALLAQALDATCKTLEQLAAISGKLATEQLAKAFKSVAETIEGKIQSEGELLAALQDMVRGLQQVLAPTA